METSNYFTKLSEVKCTTEKRKSGGTELTYVSWADAWADMKKAYPDAQYKIYEDVNGFPFWASKYGIDVKVGVTVNGLEHIVRLPVMDGNNNAMKDEEYEYEVKGYDGKPTVKKVASADTFDINKTIQRCFAKACAMHGLGLYVYRGEDLPDGSVEKTVTKTESKPASVSKTSEPAKPAYKPDLAKAEYTGTHVCKKCDKEVVGPDIREGQYGKYFICPHCTKISNANPKKDLAKEAGSIFKDPKATVNKMIEEQPKIEDVPFK